MWARLIFAMVVLGLITGSFTATYQMGKRTERLDNIEKQRAADVQQQKEITGARKEKDESATALADYRHDHPVGVVRVSNCPAPQIIFTPDPTAGAGTGLVQSVPDRDPGVRKEPAGRDIGALLDALETSADSVSRDLREQQRVP